MQVMLQACPYCKGQGHIKSYETTALEIERAFKKAIVSLQQFSIRLVCHPEVDRHLTIYDKEYLIKFAETEHAKILFEKDDTLHLNEFVMYSTLNNKKIDL